MKKYIPFVAVGAIMGAVLADNFAGPPIGPLNAQETSDNESIYRQLNLFGEVFMRIRDQYVEEVQEEELIAAAITGMLTSLDPHSAYLPPKDFGEMRHQASGQFGGLGIEVTQEDGFVKVISPIDNTPAAEAGIEAGDYITHVDGESVLGLTLDQAVERMRGEVDTVIVITVVRSDVDEPFDVKITRGTVPINPPEARLEENIAVLRVTTFNEQTSSGLDRELKNVAEEAGGLENISGIILDLRNNPGGLLGQAINVSDAFLERGEIVSTRGRNPEDNLRVNAKPGDIAAGKPMVVLINGGSASASEVVAGALQDHNRAVVVGTKSFGKGSVQTILTIYEGKAAMRLTTSRYYTPSGRSIQALGVSPDIVVEQPRRSPDEAGTDVEEPESGANRGRSESDLRGAISNDSLSGTEQDQIRREQDEAEKAARRQLDDYQLAYAINILKGLNALAPSFSAASR